MAKTRSSGAEKERGEPQRHTITIPVPSLERVGAGALNAAFLPVAVARRVLPAKRGLPLFLGLGALGAADILSWPVAVGIGVGYAVLRRGNGLTAPPHPQPASEPR
ncbi:hypothetical protein [Streptomyces sp. NPDC051776]|uniref:hypothetical protein n=1 Tax=Streptomyces sp. NPDC051776 TaxID=3155414 RepID=UPI00341F8556